MSDEFDFILLTADGCPHCASAKKGLEKLIGNKIVEIMDVTKDDKALKLAGEYNIAGVPTMIVKNRKTGIGEACELKSDLTGVMCKDKEVNF